MQQPEFITADDKRALAEHLACDVVLCLEDALAERPFATLVVSGGSTPEPFFAAIRQKPLDWRRVRVTLADERWVKPDHAASNERFVREHLLQDRAAVATFVGLYVQEQEIIPAQKECHRVIQPLQPFDAVVLGMGADGHTASLFPAAEGLHDALDLARSDLCRAMFPKNVSHPRMTLTLKALVSAQEIFVHITGDEKRRVLEYALVDRLVEKAPISAILAQHETPVSVYWCSN